MKRITIQAELDPAKCVGCSTCIHVCPVSAMRFNPERPMERTKTPPCADRCPAGNDIEGFIKLMAEERVNDAFLLLRKTNPFPAITGRVCFFPCEEGCNRGFFDEALSIHDLERAAAEYAAKIPSPVAPPRREKIAVIGSGPSGLSCAYYLLSSGCRVTIFESQPLLGGWLRYGIPEYRLPKKVLDREIAGLSRMGLETRTRVTVGKEVSFQELEAFDAIFIGSGRHHHSKLEIPGEESADITTGGRFLTQFYSGGAPALGKKVAVIGGGNSAVDAARVAMRLGSEIVLAYRRSRKEMPAFSKEVAEMEEEGGRILFLASPVRFILENGRLKALELNRMELEEPGADGRRKAMPIPGDTFTLPIDSAIVAIGEEPDISFLPDGIQAEKGTISIDAFGRTNRKKVFAGGDATAAMGSVARAIGAGRAAAAAIDSYLQGKPLVAADHPEIADFPRMNTDFFDIQKGFPPGRIPSAKAVVGFDEVHQGYSPQMARSEAERCFGCASLPFYKKEDCRGCGNCEQRCPTLAISMKPLPEPFVVKVEPSQSDPKLIQELCTRAHLNPKSIVCFCTTTRAEEIAAAILQGAKTPEEISLKTGARTGCSVLCIQPIFRLLESARVPFTQSAVSHVWYKTIPNIWEIPQALKDRHDRSGFRFAEDADFYKKLTKS